MSKTNFLERLAKAGPTPACEFCGRCVLAGICCDEALLASRKRIEEESRKLQSQRDRERNRLRNEAKASEVTTSEVTVTEPKKEESKGD